MPDVLNQHFTSSAESHFQVVDINQLPQKLITDRNWIFDLNYLYI